MSISRRGEGRGRGREGGGCLSREVPQRHSLRCTNVKFEDRQAQASNTEPSLTTTVECKTYNKGQWQARGKKCDICAGNAGSFILIAIVMSGAVSGFDVRMQVLQSAPVR